MNNISVAEPKINHTHNRENLIIRSGGQTGADMAALNWAIENGYHHCGWCPKGSRAEDGPINKEYNLSESHSYKYIIRTKQNVEDSDGTVVFSISPKLTGGTLITYEWAQKKRKPILHLHSKSKEPGSDLRAFIINNSFSDLNVAGPRISNEPEIERFVTWVLNGSLASSH